MRYEKGRPFCMPRIVLVSNQKLSSMSMMVIGRKYKATKKLLGGIENYGPGIRQVHVKSC